MSDAMNGATETNRWFYKAWSGLLLGLMTFFVINIGLMVASVAALGCLCVLSASWEPSAASTQQLSFRHHHGPLRMARIDTLALGKPPQMPWPTGTMSLQSVPLCISPSSRHQ